MNAKKYYYDICVLMFVHVLFSTLSGNDERPNMATPVVLSASVTIPMQKIFISIPVSTCAHGRSYR